MSNPIIGRGWNFPPMLDDRGIVALTNDVDEIQQANAIVAAMREVELLIISDHLEAGMEFAVESKDKAGAVKDMMAVLRAAIRK